MKLGYHRWLLSYLPIFFIVISVLVLVFFFNLSSYSRKQAAFANDQFARHVLQAMDSSLQFTEKMIINELLTDEMLKLFFNVHEPPTPYQHFEISRRIKNIALSYPPIKSLYLYRLSDDTVLTPSVMVQLEQFGDRDFVKQALREPPSYAWTGSRVYTEFQQSGYKMNVISLVKKVPLGSGQLGLLVVNVPTSAMDEVFRNLSESEISFLNVLNFQGDLMFGEARAANDSMTSIQSSYTGWIIQTGITNERMFDFFSILSDLWIIIGFLSIVGGAAGMVYMVRSNYKPIAAMRERVQLYASQKNNLPAGKPGGDEFSFINSAIDNLMQSSNRYEQKYNENIVYRKKWFFEQWLLGERPLGQEEWLEEMNRFGVSGSFGKLAVTVLEIDHYAHFAARYSNGDQHLLKFAVTNVMQETAAGKTLHKWSEWVSQDKAAIVLFMEKDGEYQHILEFCENVRAWISHHLKFTVCFGIGNRVDGIGDVAESYREALAALQYKTALGGNRSFSYADIQLLPHGRMFFFFNDVRSMAQNYRLGESEWKLQLKRLFAEMKETVLPRDDILYLMNFVIYTLQKEMAELPPDFRELWQTDALPELNGLLHQFDVLEDIEERFFAVLSETADQIRLLRESRSNHQLIRRVKEYIERHYSNPDLSLMHLNDEFRLNIKTLSRIFQEEFGEKFVDYLAKVRIEHAKELLRDMPLESVQDIAVKVGYYHASSFIRVFKKMEGGNTPGDYRKKFVT